MTEQEQLKILKACFRDVIAEGGAHYTWIFKILRKHGLVSHWNDGNKLADWLKDGNESPQS